MKRATGIVFVLLCAAVVGLVVLKRDALSSHPPEGGSPGRLTAKRGGEAVSRGSDPLADGGTADDTPGSASQTDDTLSDAGGVLFDGGVVPELVGEGPQAITFGVVLVKYAGAEDAPPGTRSKEQARALAGELATLAKEDFKAAVEKGDRGSTTQAGRMFRGVLEPAPEYVLFHLDKDEVSEPVDTPKGYWIVKRIE